MFENNSNCDSLNCIHCTVSNCVYHDTNNRCHAKSIQVDHQNSTNKEDTCCSTFEMKH